MPGHQLRASATVAAGARIHNDPRVLTLSGPRTLLIGRRGKMNLRGLVADSPGGGGSLMAEYAPMMPAHHALPLVLSLRAGVVRKAAIKRGADPP